MNCPNKLDSGQPCGDEGRMCDECFEREAREWAWLKNVSKYSVMPIDEDYYAELRDAGRI